MQSQNLSYDAKDAMAAVAEGRLLDYAQRLKRYAEDRQAVHLHLSRLRPYNRQRHHLRIVASALEPLVNGHEGALFQLSNDDLVVVCRGVSSALVREYVERLRYLFGDDPLLRDNDGEAEGHDPFCSRYDLASDYPAFLAMAQQAMEQRLQDEAARAEAEAPSSDRRRIVPIDAPRLGAVEEAIAHADLTALLRRQPICAVAWDKPPQPLLHELTISIEGLRHALLPNHDFEANPWLFRDLTRHLDRRMIAMLRRPDASDLRQSLSLNLNVATLLAPEFMQLDAAISLGRDHAVVIELQLIDVFADLAGFAFARDFLHDRGYRLCLDGMTHLSLPFVDREKLGVDLFKLQWSGDLVDRAGGSREGSLRALVERLGPERVILCRCDSPEALKLGHRLGIMLYQGHHLDHILAGVPKESDSPERLAAALRRHRMSARLPS